MSVAENIYNTNETILQNKLSTRKCWICLTMVELDKNEVEVLRDLFLAKNLYTNLQTKTKENFVQLKLLFNKIVLSACKCRKKLAHETCFNKYVDIRQNGNVNINMACPQCNLKYDFFYPYFNGKLMQIFDFIDQFLNMTSTILTASALFAAVYWCSLSYGLLTMLQIYGNEKGTSIVKNSSIFVTATMLPIIPITLVLCRFIPWENTIEKIFPYCFQYKSNFYQKKYQLESDEQIYERNTEINDYDDETQENLNLIKRVRLVVGGLALPSIAAILDKLIFGIIHSTSISSNSISIILRTTTVGLIFVGIKGICKMVYSQKKSWEEENKTIQNYTFKS